MWKRETMRREVLCCGESLAWEKEKNGVVGQRRKRKERGGINGSERFIYFENSTGGGGRGRPLVFFNDYQ